MTSIIARPMTDGSKRYRATVRVKCGTTIVHNETRTFRAKSLAVAWSTQREFEPKHSGNGTKANLAKESDTSIAALIDRYIEEFKAIQQWSRTKDHHLKLLKKLVGDWDSTNLSTEQVIEHVRQRRLSDTGPRGDWRRAPLSSRPRPGIAMPCTGSASKAMRCAMPGHASAWITTSPTAFRSARHWHGPAWI